MQRIIFICLVLALPLTAAAQYSEVGFHAGSSYYIGDLNPYKHFTHRPQFGAGVYWRVNATDRHAVRFNFLYTHVEGSDAEAKSEWRINRNLQFRSEIVEVGAIWEINFLSYEVGDPTRPFTPYVFGGIAYFRMKPMADYNGTMVELHPLGTEGQLEGGSDNGYSLGQIAIPFGMGLKFNISGRVSMGIEYGFRKLFTDYLDDVSTTYTDPKLLGSSSGPAAIEMADRSLTPGREDGTNTGLSRGNPDTNDWYAYSNISLSIRLGPTRIKCPAPL